MLSALKRGLADGLKNARGWKTDRKLVAFAVDDYGSLRLRDREAKDRLRAAGVELKVFTDRVDALETREDLEALKAVLSSAVDHQGRPAVFTAYSLAANPDVEAMRGDPDRYAREPVTSTFGRLAREQPEAYEGAWDSWTDAIERGLIQPQFHGWEHVNVGLFERKLEQRSRDLMLNLEHGSLAGVIGDPTMPGVGFTHAFGLSEDSQLAQQREILRDGLAGFEAIYGFRSRTFTPPAQKLHPDLFLTAEEAGVHAIDKPLHCQRALGGGRSRRELNRSGRQGRDGHVTVVRNVVFEPSKDMGFDPVSRAERQVAAAFQWGRPAIISSHRANFGGHIDRANRDQGLAALGDLLARIRSRWPEIEFVTVDELVARLAPVAAASPARR